MADHRVITSAAFGALPDETRAVWSAVESQIADAYCTWPDKWFDPDEYRHIDLYILQIDGIPFHYPPMSRPGYLHWTMQKKTDGLQLTPCFDAGNANWTFFKQGVTHYLHAIVDATHDNRLEDAGRHLGILLHFFQDTHVLHALEGPLGTDCFVLDRLMSLPPNDERLDTPLTLLHDACETTCDLSGYQPRAEGRSIGEAVFRLYQRYLDSAFSNRRLHVPLIEAVLAKRHAEVKALFLEVHNRLGQLTADIIHTVTCILSGDVNPGRAEELDRVHLDQLEPITRPWVLSGCYLFTAMVRGSCLDAQRRRHPLRLRQTDGSLRDYASGWGTGAHTVPIPWTWDLPKQVYARLQGQIGLHADLGMRGPVRLQVKCDDRILLDKQLDNNQPTAVLDFDITTGGLLEITVTTDRDPAAVNMAWGDLCLLAASLGA